MQFIDKGGSVMIMLGEGGESKYGTNINFLLEEYGIMINPDAVCRCSHPPSPQAASRRPSERIQNMILKLYARQMLLQHLLCYSVSPE